MYFHLKNKQLFYIMLLFVAVTFTSCKKQPIYSSEVIEDENMITEDDLDSIDSNPNNEAPEPVKKNKAQLSAYQIKYASLLNTNPEELNNNLYKLIDDWMGTPYLYGGNSKSGIDCSAFTKILMNKTYKVSLPRTANGQFNSKNVSLFKNKKYLKEGDLIFFKTSPEGPLVSHVGVYLHNDQFINSNSSQGVSISKLDNTYWKYKVVAYGRLIQ